MDIVMQLRARAEYAENGALLGEAVGRMNDDTAGLLRQAADLIEEFVPDVRRDGGQWVLEGNKKPADRDLRGANLSNTTIRESASVDRNAIRSPWKSYTL